MDRRTKFVVTLHLKFDPVIWEGSDDIDTPLAIAEDWIHEVADDAKVHLHADESLNVMQVKPVDDFPEDWVYEQG